MIFQSIRALAKKKRNEQFDLRILSLIQYPSVNL